MAKVALAAISELLANVFEALPNEVWYVTIGVAIGAAGATFGPDLWAGDEKSSGAPRVEKSDDVAPPPIEVSPLSGLVVSEPPPDTVVVTDTVRVPKKVARGDASKQSNGLPRVGYDAELIERPGLISGIPYGIVPFEKDLEPAVSVGPKELSLRVVNPNTAGYLTFRYEVPKPNWRVKAGLSATYRRESNGGEVRHFVRPQLNGSVSRTIGDYVVEMRGSLVPASPWWEATLTLQKTLFTH